MPTINPNEKVLVSSIPYVFGNPKKSDIIVFRYGKKFLIKKIKKIEKDGYLVEGENKNDSLKVQKLNRKEIVGKVIMKI
jgi:signal peptidase I